MKVLKIISGLFFLLSGSSAYSQIVLERQVVGSAGGSFPINGNIVLEHTIGEAITPTLNGGNYLFTQGFQQPVTGTGFLAINLETTASSCPTSSDGAAKITSISGCNAPYSILWSNGVSEVDSLDRLLPGLYTVTVTTGFCQETAEFEVPAGPAANCQIRIFNAFTPDGDGKSDLWAIENITLDEFRDNKVEVFNRWGQPVFSASNYDNQEVVWNGDSDSGQELQSGTYFYVVDAGGITFKGYVELIR
ncbi:MAG: gliding motility-associated C-terminal domain-containing protein [Bacteroidota bacterium]